MDRILNRRPDVSARYEGVLPQYAQSANRNRVIKILCRGRCGQTRWAEMNGNFPGDAVLGAAQLETYRAVCLKCGYAATDNYNWMR
jgi:hypothetical protein